MGGLVPKATNPLEEPESVSFESAPLEISAYVGSSAGSIICSYLAAGYTIDNVFNAFLKRQSTDPVDNFPKPLPPLTYSKMFRLRPELARVP
jgi:predicted acylesterase/phospholipase RssA